MNANVRVTFSFNGSNGTTTTTSTGFNGWAFVPPPRPPEDGAAGVLASLGVDPKLPPDAMRRAFRAKLQEVHPDHGGSEEDARRLISAYRAVEEARARYG